MRRLIYLFLVAVMLCALGVGAAETPLLPDQFGAWQAADHPKYLVGRICMQDSVQTPGRIF